MAAKICPSCGKYYKGEYCTGCGYGKPDAKKSKALEKYKKATPKKPVRFMTEEEIKKAGIGKSKTRERRVDPNARRNLLIVILLMTVGIIIWVLISKGLLFTNKREDVIKQYFTAIDTENYDKFVDTMPKEIKKVYDDERSSKSLDKKDYMREYKQPLSEYYGEGFTIELTQGKETQIPKSEISEDLAGYKEAYGSAPSVSEAYVVSCEVVYSGSKKTETVQYSCYIGKVGWKWKILNMEYVPGIAT